MTPREERAGFRLISKSQVCCRHFHDGDSKKEPLVSLGKMFASPIKGKHTRAKRAKTSDTRKDLADLWSSQFPAIFCSLDIAKTRFTAYPVTPREERTGLSIKYAVGNSAMDIYTAKLVSLISLCNFPANNFYIPHTVSNHLFL